MDDFETTASRKIHLRSLNEYLDTEFFGRGDRIVYLPIVASTNVLAMQLAQNGSEEGVVVLTDSQTAGKGRQGRRWIDVAGWNVLSSIVLRPLFPSYLLIMVASLAVVATIADTCGVAATIKWPNDILIEDRKVAGILIETSHDRAGRLVAILGIGVNVNGSIAPIRADLSISSSTTSGLVKRATTLEEECGHTVSRELFIAHLLRHIETPYLELQRETTHSLAPGTMPFSRLLREQWRNQLSTLGHPIQVRQGNTVLSGVAEDVNDQGELLLRSHSGELVSITWGDVG